MLIKAHSGQLTSHICLYRSPATR